MGLTAEQALGASLKKIKGISSGFDHATKTGDNTFSIYFTDGSKVDLTIPTPADGVSVTDVDVDSSNHLICTMSDASTIDAGLLPSTKVSVSKDTGNALVEKADGLYVSATGVEISAETGNTLVTKTDGLYVPATDISGKVDKVTGKGLSTNDYDATEKAEVAKVKDKLDSNKVVTSFSATTLDTNVPSEKLVKDNLDAKADKSSVDAIYSDDYATKNLVGSFEDGKAMQEDGSIITESNFKLSDYIDVSNGIKTYLTICTNSNSYASRNIRIHGFNASKTWVKQIELMENVSNGSTVNREYELNGISYIKISLGINDTADVRVARNTTVAEEFEILANANNDLKMLGWTIPSECPIQNYTDANGVFHQRVGRIKINDMTSMYIEYGKIIATIPNSVSVTNSDTVVRCASYKYKGVDTLTIMSTSAQTMTCGLISTNRIMFAQTETSVNDFKNAHGDEYVYYELKTEVTKSVDGNEKGNLKLLWENPNPKTAFASQTITLNSSDYDYIELYYFTDTGNTASLTNKAIKGNVPYMMSAVNSSGTLALGRRGSSYISDTSISIGDAQIGTTSNVSNANLIPYRIYGGKF